MKRRGFGAKRAEPPPLCACALAALAFFLWPLDVAAQPNDEASEPGAPPGGIAERAPAPDSAGVTAPDPPPAILFDLGSPPDGVARAGRSETASDAKGAPSTADGEPVAREKKPRAGRGKAIAAGVVGATYVGLSTWAYFAWFRGAPSSDFYVADHTWFGVNRYAGGADKPGHLWANYMFARTTTEILVRGGWNTRASSLAGGGLSFFFFTLSEIEDGFLWGFEVGDWVANAMGAALSVLMVNVPAVDDLFDFRLEYVPTEEYIDSLFESGNLDFAQDYSGQSYMLALHLKAVPRLTDPKWLRWARYVDLVAGFETRNYTPTPEDPNAVPRQTLYLGFAVNMQHVLGQVFRSDSTGRQVGHLFFDLASVPYTTLRFAEASRSP